MFAKIFGGKESDIATLLRSTQSTILLHFREGTLKGFAIFTKRETKRIRYLTLDYMGSVEKCKGIGSRVMGELKEYANRKRFVLILTGADMRAVEFYRKQ